MSELKRHCERWIKKSDGYDEGETVYVFDKFFTLFVTYNSIYFNATIYLISQGKIGKNRTGDKDSATKNMNDFIGTKELYNKLVSLESEVVKILDCIGSPFYISTERDNITPDVEEDERLVNNIKNKFNLSNVNEQRKFNISLLTLIYGVRCNMFHGKKRLSSLQDNILKPMNKILETIIKDGSSKL